MSPFYDLQSNAVVNAHFLLNTSRQTFVLVMRTISLRHLKLLGELVFNFKVFLISGKRVITFLLSGCLLHLQRNRFQIFLDFFVLVLSDHFVDIVVCDLLTSAFP